MTEGEYQRLCRIKPNLERRALIYQITRHFFKERGFLEIETPLRLPAIAPEPEIVPFDSEGWFLSTSPELHMKRLLAAGYGNIFQISRCFRKGELGRWHNPEFTMLEWYRTGADYNQMIGDTEQLVTTLAKKLELSQIISYRGQGIDLTPPWLRITVANAFMQAAGWNPVAETNLVRFAEDMVTRVVPSFNPTRPTVLQDYPATMASLARFKVDKPGVAERAEVFIGGLELANAYSELRDPEEQERRFREEINRIQQEQGRHAPVPAQFLETVANLPECGGAALGMDRLVMLFCDVASIDEVLAFSVDTT